MKNSKFSSRVLCENWRFCSKLRVLSAVYFVSHLKVFIFRGFLGYKKKFILRVPPCKKSWEILDLSDNTGTIPKQVRSTETTSEKNTYDVLLNLYSALTVIIVVT